LDAVRNSSKLQLLAHSDPGFPDCILTLPIEESGFADDVEMPAPLSPEPDLDLDTSHAVRYIQILTLWYRNLTALMQPSVQTLVASHLGREGLPPSRYGRRRFAPMSLYVDNATTSSSGAARLGQLRDDPAPVAPSTSEPSLDPSINEQPPLMGLDKDLDDEDQKAAKEGRAVDTEEPLTSLSKTFNLSTFKWHVLGDYAATIERLGTTDNYNTQVVSYSILLKQHSALNTFQGELEH
jgi:hypothetical protein